MSVKDTKAEVNTITFDRDKIEEKSRFYLQKLS